jgi:NADPH:quinone reductase-like Zn-dependent oxidoreductase
MTFFDPFNRCCHSFFQVAIAETHDFVRESCVLRPMQGSSAIRQRVPIIDRSFALADVQDAHRYIDSGQQFGKVLMHP